MAWEDAVEKCFFLNYLKIMSMCVIGITSDWDGAIWKMDEDRGPNLVVVAEVGPTRHRRSGNHKRFGHLVQ